MSLSGALIHLLFQVTHFSTIGREKFISMLVTDVWAHGLPGQCELYLYIIREKRNNMGNGRGKKEKTGNSWEEHQIVRKDFADFEQYLVIRSSKLVLSHSITGFHLCFWSCACNSIETDRVSKCEYAQFVYYQIVLPVQYQRQRERWNWEELALSLFLDRHFSVQNS